MNYKLYIPIAFLVFSGCTPPRAIVVPNPPKTESAYSSVKKGNDTVDNVVKGNTKISDELGRSFSDLQNQKVSIDEAIRRLNALKLKVSDKSEIDALVSILEKVKDKNTILERSNVELSKITKKQEELLTIVKVSLDVAEKQIIDRDNETANLRKHNDYYAKHVGDLQKEVEKSNKKLASASVYKNWVIGLVISIVLWFLAKQVLSIYFPRIGRF